MLIRQKRRVSLLLRTFLEKLVMSTMVLFQESFTLILRLHQLDKLKRS